jgi:[amino group carrier protein]-lysine/ornithine hydrolase
MTESESTAARESTAAPDDAAAIELVRQMVRIASPSGHEGELAAFVCQAMADLGFRAGIDATGNVHGSIERGPGPAVMLLGHLDTAGGPLPTSVRDGRLHGRGAVDAKGPLAAMICAAARAVKATGTITVVGVVEEETPGSRGAVAVRQNYPTPAALIIGEPSGWSSVVLGYKGKLDFTYRVQRPPTHPTNPAAKASELAVECWHAVLELLGPEASHARFDQPAATLVSVTGDLTEAEIAVSVRLPLGFDSAGLLAHVRRRCPQGELRVVNDVAACRADRRNPVVLSLCGQIRAAQAAPGLKLRSGTSDMNTLAQDWNIPMATYGPGHNVLDHSDDEHLVLADYLRSIEVLSSALTLLSPALDREVSPR